MKLRFALPLLFIALATAQKPEPPKDTAPNLSDKQKIELADALTNLIDSQAQLERLQGYNDLMAKFQAAQRQFTQLQQTVCASKDGKKYELNRFVDPKTNVTTWSCKETATVKK